MHWQQFETTKAELREEQRRLQRVLKSARNKLHAASPSLRSLLGDDVNVLVAANAIEDLLSRLESVVDRIEALPQKKPMGMKGDKSPIAREMTLRVLRVLKSYGIRPAATSDPDLRYDSPAVKILKLIGDDIGLRLAATTWRDKIRAAKKEAPDLT